MSIELGQEARDVVTGFNGTVTALIRYITGCDRYQLSKMSNDGSLRDEWFDATRLEVTIQEAIRIPGMQVAGAKPGGGPNPPPRGPNPGHTIPS